jgi:7-cyano-7-deazaguanine synthase in queuosine biosynthesis
MKYDALLGLSGGLDSVYVLYRWLSDNPGKRLMVHHCRLVNRHGRQPLETAGARGAVEWCRAQGLTNFDYMETSIDAGDLRNLPYDEFLLTVLNGLILRDARYRDIPVLLVPTPKDEYVRLGDRLTRRREKSRRIRSEFVRTSIRSRYPIEHMTKEQVLAACPPELRAVSWSCRSPKPGGERCHTCHTCRQIDAAQQR